MMSTCDGWIACCDRERRKKGIARISERKGQGRRTSTHFPIIAERLAVGTLLPKDLGLLVVDADL